MSTPQPPILFSLDRPKDVEHAVVPVHQQPQPLPSICGIPLKYISLVTLAVQNSALTIIMHYSRVSTPATRQYSAATAVLMNEILKGAISLLIAFHRVDIYDPAQTQRPIVHRLAARSRRLSREVFSQDCWKLSIPAILYVIQNNLQYVAASNLEAATFQVTYQMKILTTAAFSVLLLRKKLAASQWLALLFLAVGVGVVQIQSGAAAHAAHAHAEAMHPMKGFLAVTAACFTSGLAGVYFEMVLKNSPADLWVRNVQLSLFSLLPALAPVVFAQRGSGAPTGSGVVAGLFAHFGAWAWATVWVQVLGGLVTALVIKYSDNILKGFATSLSIVLSFLASVALFDFQLSITFVLGSSIVLLATWLYNQHPARVSFVREVWLGRNEKTREPQAPRSPSPSRPVYVALDNPSRISLSDSSVSLTSLSSSGRSSESDTRPFTRQ